MAAPSWRLAALGREGTGSPLQTERHVLAAAPGENAWLVEVERVLRARRDAVPALLRGRAQ